MSLLDTRQMSRAIRLSTLCTASIKFPIAVPVKFPPSRLPIFKHLYFAPLRVVRYMNYNVFKFRVKVECFLWQRIMIKLIVLQ